VLNRNIDLHIHTTWSDGTNSPEECVQLAFNAGLDTIAITDHNTFEGVEEAVYHAKKFNIKVVPAIEFNVNYTYAFHFLAYFKDNSFLQLQTYFYKMRSENLKTTIETAISTLKEKGISFKEKTLKKYIPTSPYIGAYAVFDGLCHQGMFSNPFEAERELFSKGKCCDFEQKFTILESFNNIKNCGGKIFLAHPLIHDIKTDELKLILPELITAGIDGLEVYHSYMTLEQTNFLKSLCAEHNLLYSGGSDYHGKNRPGVNIGYLSGDVRVPSDAADFLKYL